MSEEGAEVDAHPHDERDARRHPVSRIIKFLEKDILRLHMRSRIPWFLLFMIILHLNLWLVVLDINDAGHYYMNQGSKVDLGDSVFLNIGTLDDFWSWMQNEATHMWDVKEVESPNKPLGLLVVRQFRVSAEDSATEERRMIPKHIDTYLRNTTLPSYSSSWVDQRDFVPHPRNPVAEGILAPDRKPPWKSNIGFSKTSNQLMPRGTIVQGRLATYDVPEYAYTMYFEFNESKADVLSELQALQTLRWVDDATRVVFVEVVSFNIAKRSFLLTSFAMEISSTGLVLPTVHLFPFVIHNFWQQKFIFVFMLDIMIMIFTVCDMGDLFWTLTKRSPDDKTIIQLVDVWTVIQLSQGILFTLCYVSRIAMWAQGILLQDDNYYTKNAGEFLRTGGSDYLAKELLLFDTMSHYALLYEQAYTRIAIGTLVAWIRMLGFFRYWKNFGILAETMSNSSSILGGWCITFFLIFIPYSIGGHILFGNTLKSFRSLTTTIAFLLFMIARGSIDNYDSMESMYPFWAPVFLFSFLALGWLVMLNLFIAIVTGTFEHVQSAAPPNGGYHKWHPRVFLAALQKYGHRKMQELEDVYKMSNRRLGRHAKKVDTKKVDDKAKAEMKNPKETVTRANQYLAIDRLKELGCDGVKEYNLGDMELSKVETYKEVKGVIPMTEIDKVFQLCEYEAMATSTFKTVSERWTTQTEKKTEYVYRDLLPTVKRLEEDLSKTESLEIALERATQLYGDVAPRINSLRVNGDAMQETLTRCNEQLPNIAKARDVTKKIETKQRDIEITGEQAEKALTSTREVAEMLTHVQAKMNKSSDYLLKRTRKSLWGLSEQEYDEVAPTILDSRPGLGRIEKVEKLGKPKRLHAGEVPLPKDGYTTWLKSKVGDDAVLQRRLAAVKSEIDENLL
eukprot:TRINITY_DN9974_c0_g1_i1.p1 TRINITY_DN9974_c0_g1~~TRINITY_DN9974_c0_g1_i1.p1  ORF type:complete len:903 (+),score=295.72 TRINITY_DN9974_c0_g1_i1:869-3577(+)